MPDYLLDFSPASLIRAMEENLTSWLDIFSRLEGAQIDGVPGLRKSITDIPMALFNSVMETQLAPENADAAIELVVADAQRRNVPLTWWTGPSTRPEDMPSRLLSHGFTVDEDGPGMAVELDRLNDRLPMPEGVTILPATDDASWHAWSQACLQGFEAPPARLEFGVQQWSNLLSRADPATTQAYTAWLDGKPVAASMLQLGGGVAGIYAVATLPEARRKGIGAQVTLHALKEGRRRGYKIGVLEASDMGYPVYRSLGFQEYCRITSYVWRPQAV
jgi:ribosomal protein S18 acetylase RimI-like enzyme